MADDSIGHCVLDKAFLGKVHDDLSGWFGVLGSASELLLN